MIYSNPAVFKQVLDQIRSQIDPENPPKNKFHIILIPKMIYPYEEELEELGLFHSIIKLHSFQWLPLHLDTGILSLELPSMFHDIFLRQDLTFLPSFSKVLWQLFFIVGKPAVILSLGHHANTILKQIDILSEDRGGSDRLNSDFGALIIIDRNLDYPSALLTPGTYSGLLNEVYGVKCGICEHKSGVDEPERLFPAVKKQPVCFNLDSNQDEVYSVIKNSYFTEVTSILSKLTKELRNENQQSKEMALDEIKHYVKTKLQATKIKKKMVHNHLLAAESIINVLGSRYETQQEIESNIIKNENKTQNLNYLEELLISEDDKLISLRLFCLICITQKLTENEAKCFWKKYIHQFGYKYGMAYKYLINAGFLNDNIENPSTNHLKMRLMPKFTTKEFYINCNKLKQIPQNPEKINLKSPTCASYVFGGCYIPLVTQIASMLLNATPAEEIKAKLEGLGVFSWRNDKGYPLLGRSVLIYLIGGVTYAEIAACDMLETITGARVVIMSDRVVSGNDLMRDFLI